MSSGVSAASTYEREDGLHCVSGADADSRFSVIFVHGLGGGAHSTWFSGEDSELGFWPAALARRFPQGSFWTLHYTARVLDWNPLARTRTIDILDKSAWLLDQIDLKQLNTRPIVFVTHSLGGVLVKQALQFAQFLGPESWRSVWENTHSVVFLATPHDGSRVADVGVRVASVLSRVSLLTRLFFRPSPALRHLLEHNPSLRYLGDWYRAHAPAQGINSAVYAEGRPLAGTLIVNEGSANPRIPDCPVTPLADHDHITIAKPRSAAEPVFERACRCLDDLVRELALGSVASVRERPALDDEMLARLSADRDRIAWIAGFWWERVDIDGINHLSRFRILADPVKNTLTLAGRSYTAAGESVADWRSELAKIEVDAQQVVVEYFWTGKHVKGDYVAVPFHGFGRMEFPRTPTPEDRIDRGGGGFWEVNEGEPNRTRYKPTELRRIADEGDIETMLEGSDSAIAECIRDTLRRW